MTSHGVNALQPNSLEYSTEQTRRSAAFVFALHRWQPVSILTVLLCASIATDINDCSINSAADCFQLVRLLLLWSLLLQRVLVCST
mgnify:CR=1 FL=1